MADRAQLLNDGEEAQRLILDGRLACLWSAIPGIVTKVNFSAMTCEVQPAIQGIIEDENQAQTYVDLPILINVPIVFPSAGGFTITLPIAVGDEVLVVFASRCIDSWWQLGGTQKPMEARMHDLSDGFALPGPRSQPRVISNISSTGAQIRNDAGTSYVEISADGKIKLVSNDGIEIDGDIEVTGSIVASGEVTGNGIALSTHVHPVTTAPGTTGAPVP